MSDHKVRYNKFYYSNLCHVCKDSKNIKRCTGCKSIAYCSKEHQQQDWKLHKKLCRAIAATDKNIIDLKIVAANSADSFDEYKNWRVYRSLLWLQKLGRHFHEFEAQMWMFPRACAVCYTKDVTIDCANCLNTSYCSEAHKNLHVSHSQHCDALKLCMDIDVYYFHEKFIPTGMSVYEFDEELDALPSSFNELFPMERTNRDRTIQFISVCDVVAPAITMLYGMEQSGILKDRLFNKAQLTVHIVGADVSEARWFWKLITELIFHWIRNLESLVFYVVGPELNHKNVVKTPSEQCRICQAKRLKTKIIFHQKLYHQVARKINKPDLVVAFNSGIHESGDNLWMESIDSLTMHRRVPLLLTAYTLNEIEEDLSVVKTKSRSRICNVLEPRKNPFGSMRPFRNWENGNDPVFYVNDYIAMLRSE